MTARRTQHGFTLVEMIAAVGVLAFGLTALVGVLSVGVDTRRGAEQRVRASLMADQILHSIEQHVLPEIVVDPADENPVLEVPARTIEEVDGFPGMKYHLRFDVDPAWPELVLVRVTVSWREQGELVGQDFERLMRRAAPYAQRVAERRQR